MDAADVYRSALEALARESVGEALGAALEAMMALTGADRGFVLTRGDEPGALDVLARRVARASGLLDEPPSLAIARRALESGAPVRIENALDDPEFRGRPSVIAISVLSVMAVPIIPIEAEDAAAVVYLDSARLTGIFSEEAERAGALLAAAVAPGVRSAARERALAACLAAAEDGEGGPAVLGRSPAFLSALERALRAARSGAPVLLEGESGTGKEVFARAIHRASPRARGPFVPIHCGAIPEATLEAELFGYKRGAFTGAIADRIGRIEAAGGGTLFLDEVGDMPAALQVKLLRVLQSGEVQTLGEPRPRRVDVRIIAATHRDLRALVQGGGFREDLLYRLRVVPVALPPLRERGDDVLLLAEAFARRFAREMGSAVKGVGAAAREALIRHRFPGNVRELENAIRHGVVFAQGSRIAPEDLPPEVVGDDAVRRGPDEAGALAGPPRDAEELRVAKDAAAARLERLFLYDALARAGGNVSLAARATGMNRTVLHELMVRHGVQSGDFRGAS